MSETITIRRLALVEYQPAYRAMSTFTSRRGPKECDEIWCLQHPPVYTLGLSGKREHVLDAGSIPLVATDRGGQVTYHGPGQLIIYPLLDLRRRRIGIRDYVHLLEQSVIDYLLSCGLTAQRRSGAPGVYIDGGKIAALGVRVRRGCSYHGLAFNVDMDTTPFDGINPCGYPDLKVVQLADFQPSPDMETITDGLTRHLLKNISEVAPDIIIKQDLDDLVAGDAAA